MAAKIRKDDEVIVISGKDKGKTGKVTQVFPSEHRVLGDGVNMRKKHQKPDPNKQTKGSMVDKAVPIDISNVAIYNPETKKADRVGFRFEDGKKVRFFKSNGNLVPTANK